MFKCEQQNKIKGKQNNTKQHGKMETKLSFDLILFMENEFSCQNIGKLKCEKYQITIFSPFENVFLSWVLFIWSV